MTAFCTYCSAEKNRREGVLPAIERYRSDRIRRVYAAALSVGAPFYVLSGKFGLIEPWHPIPFYDHQLAASEVRQHSRMVAAQIDQFALEAMIFFMRPVAEDEKLKPYLASLRAACEQAKIALTVVEMPPPRSSGR